MISCDLCDYTTTRSYNFKRHLERMHPDAAKPTQEPSQALKQEYCQCSDCGKILVKRNMALHQESCKKIPYEAECDDCHRKFINEKSLKQHKQVCQKSIVTQEPNGSMTTGQNQNHGNINNTTNATTNNNNHSHNTTNNNTTNNYNVLVFPKERDRANFDFIVSHINSRFLRRYVTTGPDEGFRRFMWKILQNPANRMVKKISDKSKYCKVHIGNNRWVKKLDRDVIPEVAHHMTTAAIARYAQAEGEPWYQRLQAATDAFLGHVREVNESTPDEIKSVLHHIREHLEVLYDYEKQKLEVEDSD